MSSMSSMSSVSAVSARPLYLPAGGPMVGSISHCSPVTAKGAPMPERLQAGRLYCRGMVYTLSPALDLPIRYAGGLWTVEEPRLGLVAFAANTADLRRAASEQLHILWYHLVDMPRTDLCPEELAARHALLARVTPKRAKLHAVEPPRCPDGCMGGNGLYCRCTQGTR